MSLELYKFDNYINIYYFGNLKKISITLVVISLSLIISIIYFFRNILRTVVYPQQQLLQLNEAAAPVALNINNVVGLPGVAGLIALPLGFPLAGLPVPIAMLPDGSRIINTINMSNFKIQKLKGKLWAFQKFRMTNFN